MQKDERLIIGISVLVVAYLLFKHHQDVEDMKSGASLLGQYYYTPDDGTPTNEFILKGGIEYDGCTNC